MDNIASTRQLTVKLALQAGNYKSQLASINKANKLLESNFKTLSSSSKDFEKTLEGKQAKLKLVASQLDNAKQKVRIYKNEMDNCNNTLTSATKAYVMQEEKVKSLKQQLEEAKSVYGENSKEVKELQAQLKEEEKALESNRKAVINADNSLSQMNINLNNAQREVNRLEDELKSCEKNASNFSAKMQEISDKTGDMANNLDKGGTAITNAGKKVSVASAAVTGIGVASVRTAANFESAMSQVAATMGITAEEINNGSEDFKKLEDAAKEMGATTEFSASQAAEALNYLALAGYDVDKSISTLPVVLDLAASGGIDLATAADMVTDAMSALGDTAGTTESFVDKMAKTSQKSNTSVQQLGNAILTVGGTAKVLAGETTELNTALGILADNGIKGAEGGTALRNIILSLTAPTDKAAGKMKELGLEVLDAEGNMRPIKDIMSDLNGILGDMGGGEKTKVLSNLFNSADLKAVNALLSASVTNMSGVNEKLKEMGVDIEANADMLNYLGSTFEANEDKVAFLDYAMQEMDITVEQATALYDGLNEAVQNSGTRFDELAGYVEDSEGAASNMAKTMQANLNGSLTQLGSALEGVQIVIGNYFIPIIKKAAEWLTKFASWFTNANPAIQNTVVAIGVFIATLGPALLIIGALISSIGQVVGAFSLFSGAIASAGGLGAWFSASMLPIIATIGSVIGAVITIAMAIKENWEGIKSATSDLISQCKPYFEQFKLAFSGLWDTCKNIYYTVIQPLFKIIGQVIETCIRLSIPILQALLTVFTTVFNTISSVWNGIGKPVFNFIISIVQSVMKAYQPVFQNMSSLFSSCVSSISSIYNSLLKPAFDSLINIVNKVGQVVSPIFHTVKNVVTGALNAILNPINAVIKGFNSLISVAGKVANAVGGTLGKLFKGKSVDVNANVGTTYSSTPFNTNAMDNIAMSGSYYSRKSSLVGSFSELANLTTRATSGIGDMSTGGISVNNSLDTSKLEELMSNMINILTTQNSLIKENKPVLNLDGQQLSNKLDKISGQNMRLYERFNV